MSYIQYLGNGKGYIYAALPDGSKTIAYVEPNTVMGVRNMRLLGAGSAPISASRSAVGTIQITAVPSAGNITAVTINSVNQIGASVAATIGDVNQTAIDIASAINAFSPSGYQFTADAIDDIVYVYSSPQDGAIVNGFTITVTVSNIAITTTTTALSGGSNQDGVYDTTFGFQFYLDPSPLASNNSISLTAEDVSSFIVIRGLQSGIFTESLSVSTSARLLNITRCSAFTNILTDTFSGNPQTDLAFIDTNGFVQGDVIRLTQQESGRVVTLIDANIWGTQPANIYLTDQTPFNCQDNKSIELRLQYDPTLGSIWVENGRSISQGYIAISRNDMITLINSDGVTIGQDYLIQGPGLQGGVLVQGVALNAITQSGQFVSYVPDYQNLSGDFAGVWTSKLPSVVAGKLYAWNGAMYEALTTTTGSDPSTDPNYNFIFDTDPRYVQEVDNVQYNILNNEIVKREDGRGNVVYGSTAILNFKWGADNCYGNIITEGSFAACNVTGDFISNIMSNVQSNFSALTTEFIGNTFSNILFVAGNENILSVSYNNFQGDAGLPTIISFIDYLSPSNIVSVKNNRISATTGAAFYVSGNQGIASNTFTGTQFSIYTNGFGVSSSVVNSVFGLAAHLTKAFTAEIIDSSVSTYSTIVDLDLCMTGTTLDLQGIPLGSASDPLIAGEWILTSASGGYTINKIIGSTGQPILTSLLFPVKISSSAGTTNYITPTAIGSATVGQFIGESTSTISLVGRTQGSDYVTFQVNPSAGQVLEIIDTGLYNLPPVTTPTLQTILDYDHSLTNGIVKIGTNTGGASGNYVVAIGDQAANGNTVNNVIAIGQNAGLSNGGTNNIAIGTNSAIGVTGTNLVSIGSDNVANYTDSNAIAIGTESMNIAVGVTADETIAIGYQSLNNSIGSVSNTIAIGTSAGANSNFGSTNVYIGNNVAQSSAGSNNVYIGNQAGTNASGTLKVGIGFNAGINNDSIGSAVSIGVNAGANATSTASEAVYIGQVAGFSNTGANVVFLNTNAGKFNTGTIVTGIGPGAAENNQGDNVTAVGNNAGKLNQGDYSDVYGFQAGYQNTGNYLNALGYQAGYQNTGDYIIAIGNEAASGNTASFDVVAIGGSAAFGNTGNGSVVAVGVNAAYQNTGQEIVAIGQSAADGNTGDYIVAFGQQAASNNVGSQIVAIGSFAAQSNLGILDVVAIGNYAAAFNGGHDIVAIGKNAGNSNGISNAFILSNNELPSYLNYATASAAITLGAGASSGSTYLYHDQTTNSIGAVRIP
jgi:hypothetical protein